MDDVSYISLEMEVSKHIVLQEVATNVLILIVGVIKMQML